MFAGECSRSLAIVCSAILSVFLRSQGSPEEQIQRKGPNPSSKISPMMSQTQEGYLKRLPDVMGELPDVMGGLPDVMGGLPDVVGMGVGGLVGRVVPSGSTLAPALVAMLRKLLPQSQNFMPLELKVLIASTCLLSEAWTSCSNWVGSWTIMWLAASTVSPAGQQPPAQGLWREVWSDPRSTSCSSSCASLSHRSTMFPRKAIEVASPFALVSLTLTTSCSRSQIFSLTQPCLSRLSRADSMTSAVTEMQPQMSAALGWAPLMPPSPELTNTTPFMECLWRYLRAALRRVRVVPWTMPCGPMQQKLPAVICPYWVLP